MHLPEKTIATPKIILDMEDTVKKYHSRQFRTKGKEPYWHHCVNVRDILRETMEETGELEDEQLSTDMQLAAMGHDLLEDTGIQPETIRAKYGERVLALITDLTNENGDFDRNDYNNKIAGASEEVKLIKLADMTENCMSVANGIDDLGMNWVVTFFLPIIDEMKEGIKQADFTKYKQTAARLLEKLESAYEKLHNSIEQCNH